MNADACIRMHMNAYGKKLHHFWEKTTPHPRNTNTQLLPVLGSRIPEELRLHLATGALVGVLSATLHHGRLWALQAAAEQLGSIPPAHQGFRGRQSRWCCERHRINARGSQATGKVAAGVAVNFRREIHGGGFLRSLAIWLAGWCGPISAT